jgi:SAM-dependent methyltransferase
MMQESYSDSGWEYSAPGWIELIDRGETNRELLLDPVMLDLAGDVDGKRVLDAGCGEGRFSRMLAERGASVVGFDPTSLLIRAAKQRHGDGEYLRASAESVPFTDASFDLVVSYLSLIDISAFREAIGEWARVLAPGGRLLAANLGFVTASKGWERDDEGRRLHHRVDRYANEFQVVLEWAGIRIVNWHRPLASYMQAYLEAGLTLRRFLEPVPPDDSLRADPRFEDWYRVPLFNVMLWEKPY